MNGTSEKALQNFFQKPDNIPNAFKVGRSVRDVNVY